jgi:anti-anti-sigma factor
MTSDAEAKRPRHAVEWSDAPGGAAVARISGVFDETCVRDLEAAAVRFGPGSSLILNLRGVEYLSSSGIGEIVHLASRFRLVLASPSEAVVHLLQLAEVSTLLDVVATEEEALMISRPQ